MAWKFCGKANFLTQNYAESLLLSTKFPNQELGEITAFFAVNSLPTPMPTNPWKPKSDASIVPRLIDNKWKHLKGNPSAP